MVCALMRRIRHAKTNLNKSSQVLCKDMPNAMEDGDEHGRFSWGKLLEKKS